MLMCAKGIEGVGLDWIGLSIRTTIHSFYWNIEFDPEDFKMQKL